MPGIAMLVPRVTLPPSAGWPAFVKRRTKAFVPVVHCPDSLSSATATSPAVCSALLLAGIATAEVEAAIPIALTPNQHLLLFGLLWWFDS